VDKEQQRCNQNETEPRILGRRTRENSCIG